MRALRWCSLVALAFALSACGGDKAPGATGDGSAEALPAPAGGKGSVTGMPDKPGPGQIGPHEPTAEAAVAVDEQGNPILPDDTGVASDTVTAPADGAAVDPNATTAEPTPQDAVAVVRDYYAAINRRDFARAYALWSDGGRASGQDEQQFAAGFADTTGVSVELLAPGQVDAGAGQRHIEVPVAITATRADGSQHKFVGAYTLRRTVVDGASAEQRAWRIGSADIREVTTP